jgi:glycosyltransferase involved in cell wall biosynthesis
MAVDPFAARGLRSPELSVVIPLYNEAPTLEALYARLARVLGELRRPYEIIFVDDGSTDETFAILSRLAARDAAVRVVKLARNYGQTAALAAGFDRAAGSVIVAMDGDLQHAPEEMPKLLAKLDEGYDIVSGWRVRRRDSFWSRQVPSRIANWIVGRLSGVRLHDFGTTFKAYRAPVIKRIALFGDLHRFIPALAAWQGARIAEVPIVDGRRVSNRSHYGLGRTWRVLADLVTVRFLLKYATRPLHLFGPPGFLSLASGLAGGGYVALKKLATGDEVFLRHGPLLMLSVLLIDAGIMLIAVGIVSEMITRLYFDGRRRRIYTVEAALPRHVRGPQPRRLGWRSPFE